MYCLKCGYKIPAGAAFCPNCGAKVQAEEATRHSDVPSNAARPGTEAQPDTEPSGQSGQPAAQTEQGTQTEPESQPDAVPPASPSVPPAAPQPVQNGAQPAGDPLAVMVGKHADYYLAEFKKIDAGQKTRFNWAAFFLGPCMCFYRSCHELFKKYYLLYFILFGISCVIFTASSVSMAYGAFGVDFVLTGIYNVLSAVINTYVFIMQIRFARNFNREYYNHCKQQLEQPASARKPGTSAKKMWLFILAVAVIWIVWYAATMLITQQVQNAYWDSLLEDSSYSEETYTESSSYYDEATSNVEEESAISIEQTPHYEVGGKEILENAWSSVLASSNESIVEITFIYDDCDDDGLYEAFAATAEEYDEDMGIYFGAKIYFIDSYGNVTLICDTAPEGGPLYGKPNNLDLLLSPDNIHDFFVWDVYAGTSAPSLVWGVQDGQVYESNISGQYCSVHWAEGPGLAGYQVDYSQGYRDYIIYRLNYDSNTASFTAVPDNAAYPEGEEVYLIR